MCGLLPPFSQGKAQSTLFFFFLLLFFSFKKQIQTGSESIGRHKDKSCSKHDGPCFFQGSERVLRVLTRLFVAMGA